MSNYVLFIYQPNSNHHTLESELGDMYRAYDPETKQLRDGVTLLSNTAALIEQCSCFDILIELCTHLKTGNRGYILVPIASKDSIETWIVGGNGLPETKARLKRLMAPETFLMSEADKNL
jgi:hypothetical protein